MNSLEPFRSRRKVKFAELLPPPIPRYQPKHQRRYTLHHIHGPKTWMIDFMKLGKQTILNIIHCNTRFWLPHITPDQSAEAVMTGIQATMMTVRCNWTVGPVIDTLISDAAKTFTSTRLVNDFCESLGIKQIAFNMDKGGIQVLPKASSPTTSQEHNQLSIIDRISRTLRDMVFNVQRTQPNFELNDTTIKQLAMIYNKTPHETLSKTMGFDVSPQIALANKKLQDELVRRWTQENYKLTDSYAFTSIKKGMHVYLYAPKQLFEKRRNNVERVPYVIVDVRAGNYVIQRVDDLTGDSIRTVQRKDFIPALF